MVESARGGAIFSRDNRLESDWRDAEHRDHFGRGRCSFSHAARHRRRRSGRGAQGDRAETYRGRGIFRRVRLFHADLLRLVCLAHDRTQRGSLSHCRAHRLHELFDRPQYRRHGFHRRRCPLSHLFRLWARRHRSRQDLLCRRPDVLARQRHRAGTRRHLSSASRRADRPAAGLAQSGHRRRDIAGADILRCLGLERAARNRPAANGRSSCRAGRPLCCRSASAFSISAAARSPCTCCCRPSPNIGFVTMAVVFVSATLLGFASHAPGGLGVFDAAMLVALWQFDKESVLAGLLLFRLLYYIIPFALALAILGVTRNLAEPERHASIAGTRGDTISGRADPQRDRSGKNRRRLIMAIDDERRSLPTPVGDPVARRLAGFAWPHGSGGRRKHCACGAPCTCRAAGAVDRAADRRPARSGDRARSRGPGHRVQRDGHRRSRRPCAAASRR